MEAALEPKMNGMNGDSIRGSTVRGKSLCFTWVLADALHCLGCLGMPGGADACRPGTMHSRGCPLPAACIYNTFVFPLLPIRNYGHETWACMRHDVTVLYCMYTCNVEHPLLLVCMQMEDNMKRSRCQSVFLNLLQARGVVNQNATVFIRELSCTSRCDTYLDLTAVRKAYHDLVGGDSMQRIASFDEAEEDERRAVQAAVHYYDWTRGRLLNALDWPSWAWFHTVYRVERAVAAVFTPAAAAGGLGGWSFVRPSWRRQGQPQPAVPIHTPGEQPSDN